MGIFLPWTLMMSLQAYQHGIKPQQLPEPYWFLWGSVAMIVAALMSEFNHKLGILMAWAFVGGAFTYTFTGKGNQ